MAAKAGTYTGKWTLEGLWINILNNRQRHAFNEADVMDEVTFQRKSCSQPYYDLVTDVSDDLLMSHFNQYMVENQHKYDDTSFYRTWERHVILKHLRPIFQSKAAKAQKKPSGVKA
jgi:hypothetical protein